MNHSNLIKSIRLKASKVPGVKLFPNPNGLAYNGTFVKEWTDRGSRYMILKNPRPVKYGLGAGTLDTIGFKAERIGRVVVPRFISFDAKTPGDSLSPGQKNFIKMVNKYGGIADEVRQPEDVIEKLNTPLKLELY